MPQSGHFVKKDEKSTRVKRFHPSFFILLPFLLCLPILWALLPGGLPNTADGPVHFIRAAEMVHAWADGVLVPRWAQNLGYGYGIPLFVYAPPLPYQITAALHSLGLSLEWAYKGMLVAGIAIAAYGSYNLSRALLGVWAGAVGAAAFLYAPILLRELFIQGNAAQYLAWTFPAWAAWAILRLYANEGRRIVYTVALALALVGSLLSHNAAALIAMGLVGGLGLWLFLFMRDARGLLGRGRGQRVGPGVECVVLGPGAAGRQVCGPGPHRRQRLPPALPRAGRSDRTLAPPGYRRHQPIPAPHVGRGASVAGRAGCVGGHRDAGAGGCHTSRSRVFAKNPTSYRNRPVLHPIHSLLRLHGDRLVRAGVGAAALHGLLRVALSLARLHRAGPKLALCIRRVCRDPAAATQRALGDGLSTDFAHGLGAGQSLSTEANSRPAGIARGCGALRGEIFGGRHDQPGRIQPYLGGRHVPHVAPGGGLPGRAAHQPPAQAAAARRTGYTKRVHRPPAAF